VCALALAWACFERKKRSYNLDAMAS
jgi:hypothetical protein